MKTLIESRYAVGGIIARKSRSREIGGRYQIDQSHDLAGLIPADSINLSDAREFKSSLLDRRMTNHYRPGQSTVVDCRWHSANLLTDRGRNESYIIDRTGNQ